MKRYFYLSFIVLSFVFVCSSCQNLSTPNETKSSSSSEKMEISGPLLAEVGDWRIGLGDFQDRIETLKPLAEQQGTEINAEFKKRVLNELVRTALLAQEAKSRGIGGTGEVRAALRQYKQNLLAQKLTSEETQFIDVTNVEIENFYSKNKAYFKKPGEVKVREIVFNSQPVAKDLYIDILSGKISFSAAAQQNSIAPSASKGGDLGYMTYDPNKKFQKFWNIVLSLSKGEVTKFKGDDGRYYIVKVEDKKESQTTPLSEVKDQIIETLKVQKRKEKIDQLVSNARQKVEAVMNEDLLQ